MGSGVETRLIPAGARPSLVGLVDTDRTGRPGGEEEREGGGGRHGGFKRRCRRQRRIGLGLGIAAAVPDQDLRDGGGPGDEPRGVVGPRRRQLRRVEPAGLLAGPAAQVLQAQQLLQLHQAAQHLRECPRSRPAASFQFAFGSRRCFAFLTISLSRLCVYPFFSPYFVLAVFCTCISV